MTPLFPLGQVVVTLKIAGASREDEKFHAEVLRCIKRHQSGDFSEMKYAEDVAANQDAIKNGGRILSTFNTSKGVIWIITEQDRSATTVLFPEEY